MSHNRQPHASHSSPSPSLQATYSDLSGYNQALWARALIDRPLVLSPGNTLVPALRSEAVEYGLDYSITVTATAADGTVTILADNLNKSASISCPPKQISCGSITLLAVPFITSASYRVRAVLRDTLRHYLDAGIPASSFNVSSEDPQAAAAAAARGWSAVAAVTTSIRAGNVNSSFTRFQISGKYTFLALSIILFIAYSWAMCRGQGARHPASGTRLSSSRDQSFVWALSFLLIWFNDPAAILSVTAPTFSASAFYAVSALTFVALLLLYWMVSFDDARSSAVNGWALKQWAQHREAAAAAAAGGAEAAGDFAAAAAPSGTSRLPALSSAVLSAAVAAMEEGASSTQVLGKICKCSCSRVASTMCFWLPKLLWVVISWLIALAYYMVQRLSYMQDASFDLFATYPLIGRFFGTFIAFWGAVYILYVGTFLLLNLYHFRALSSSGKSTLSITLITLIAVLAGYFASANLTINVSNSSILFLSSLAAVNCYIWFLAVAFMPLKPYSLQELEQAEALQLALAGWSSGVGGAGGSRASATAAVLGMEEGAGEEGEQAGFRGLLSSAAKAVKESQRVGMADASTQTEASFFAGGGSAAAAAAAAVEERVSLVGTRPSAAGGAGSASSASGRRAAGAGSRSGAGSGSAAAASAALAEEPTDRFPSSAPTVTSAAVTVPTLTSTGGAFVIADAGSSSSGSGEAVEVSVGAQKDEEQHRQ